jgi:hypothetical protein
MIFKKPNRIEKALDQMHEELRKEEKKYCPKCRPIFREFVKRWFEKYTDK